MTVADSALACNCGAEGFAPGGCGAVGHSPAHQIMGHFAGVGAGVLGEIRRFGIERQERAQLDSKFDILEKNFQFSYFQSVLFSMPLSEPEYGYFQSLAGEDTLRIALIYQKMANTMIPGSEDEKHRNYVKSIKNLTKEALDGRVNAYIETFKHFNKYPSDEEYLEFIKELGPIAVAKAKIYEEFCANPFGPKIASALAKNTLKSLTVSLEGMVPVAIYPLERFLLEGNAKEEREKSQNPSTSLQKKRHEPEQITSPSGENYKVLNLDIFDKVRESRFHVIEVDDFITADDLQKLVLFMYNFPERDFSYYPEKNGRRNKLLEEAFDQHVILVKEIEFHYFKHPNFIRDYIKILPRDGEYDWDWEKEVAQKGPEFLQIKLELSERQKRALEIEENVAAHKASDSNPLQLKPNFHGIGIDLPKLWKWIKKKFGSHYN